MIEPVQVAGATVHEVITVPDATGAVSDPEIAVQVIPVEVIPEVNVVDGDVTVAVLVNPVTVSVPVHATVGVVKVAFQTPPEAEKAVIVGTPEHPPP